MVKCMLLECNDRMYHRGFCYKHYKNIISKLKLFLLIAGLALAIVLCMAAINAWAEEIPTVKEIEGEIAWETQDADIMMKLEDFMANSISFPSRNGQQVVVDIATIKTMTKEEARNLTALVSLCINVKYMSPELTWAFGEKLLPRLFIEQKKED